MTDTYITNITIDTTDDAGNNLIGSNDVLAVFYYDATSNYEEWLRDWNIVNPVSNHSFTSPISASDWTYSTDGGNTMFFDRFAGWKSTDLAKDLSVTSSGYHAPYTANFMTDWDYEHGWETAGPQGNGAYAATIDFGEDKEFNHIYILPGWDTDTTKFLKDYRIGVSDTGTENDFTIVASGTASGTYGPEINFVGNGVSGRYVKLYIDSNYGSSSYTRVGKFSVFNEPEWSMHGFKNYNVSGGTYAKLAQDINFTSIDTMFFDARGYFTNGFQVGQMEVKIDGDQQVIYDWASGVQAWLDTVYDEGWFSRWEESVDVSSYTGTKTMEVIIWEGTYHRRAFQGYFDDFRVSPRWYTEIRSSTRGSTAHFPDEVFIISDRQGISIINKSDNSLWMRFDVGPGNALQSTARDIFAADGKIYLATSRGLVVIDFTTNRIWKYDETGVYYRMSIAKRNEYSFWFTYSTGDLISSSDVHSVHGSYWSQTPSPQTPTLNIVVGTGAGMSVIFPGGVSNSSFSYPVKKVRIYEERTVYIGGFGVLSIVGVMNDRSAFWYDNFDEQTIMYSHEGILKEDTFDGNISDQWYNDVGNLPIVSDNGCFTISGTKLDYGDSVLIQEVATPSRPFTATAEVKIADWPDRNEGGFHFGVTSGWPYNTERYSDGDKALMLAAHNGYQGPYFQDESFTVYPSRENWVQNFTSYSTQTVEMENGIYKIRGTLPGSYGTSYSTGPVTGSNRVWPSISYLIAKIKVKVTDMYSVGVGRVLGFVFGVSDGQYLGEGAGTAGMAMAIYGGNTDPNPPVYCMATKTNNIGWSWDTTNSGTLFSGDGTSSAGWHTWEIRYVSSTDRLYGAVDGISLGYVTNVSMSNSLGIIFGPVGNQTDNVEVYYKDFEVDYGTFQDHQKEKYVLHKYDSGEYQLPTVSGTHLDGLDFFDGDGTDAADWRLWKITYDGTTLSGSVDDQHIGTSVSLDLGNSPRVFFAYNMPATQSGTNKSTDIKVRNFSIDYSISDTLISGSPNNFFMASGTYNADFYDALYLATSSGVEQLLYNGSATVGSVPTERFFYSIADGGSVDRALLYGNVPNCSVVEVEEGAAGPTGLMYAGTSRFHSRGWERMKDRESVEEADFSMSIGCTADGSKLFMSLNRSGGAPNSHYIYMKDLGTVGSAWYPIGQALSNSGFQDVQDSRSYGLDLEDGNIYFIGPIWFGIYNIKDELWINPEVNLGTGNIYTGGAPSLDYWETAAATTRNELYFAYNNAIGSFRVKEGNWTWGKLHYSAVNLPLSSAGPAFVYSDVDDSLYMMQYSAGGTNNFFKLPMSTLIWSSSLSDCPVPLDFSKGVSAFYRPYDESIYFLMLGADDAFGRKLLRYDVKAEIWETWGVDVPSTAYDYVCGCYSHKQDTLYVTLGAESARVYKYMFPVDDAPRFVSWTASDGLVPEESVKARYHRISLSSGYVLGSDTFSNSSFGTKWNVFTSYTDTYTYVTQDDYNATFYNAYNASDAHAMICSPAPMPGCDFIANIKVRIRDVRKSNSGINNNTFMIGVTDFKGSPGYYSEDNGDSEKGNTMVGVNGMWMIAYNDQTTTERYSLCKREQGTDTTYISSSYQLFNGTDGTPSADYRDWKLVYTHSTNGLSAYIDDVLVGSTTLAGDGFKHGLMINVGSICTSTSVSGELIVDTKDFTLSTEDSSALVSNYLQMEDSDLYGYNHYEKFDSTLSSGIPYSYEIECRILNDTVNDNVLLNSLGCIEDGHKKAFLGALNTGTRQIGVYIGGDPSLVSSYTGVIAQDWSIQSTYKINHDDDRIKVYVDDATTAAIDIAYTSLPETRVKRVRFGSLNPYEPDIRYHFDNNSHRLTVSGTWTHSSSVIAGSYFGDCRTHTGTSSDAVIFRFNDTGQADLYVFYSARSSRAVDAPFTIYHEGVITLPTDDGYSTTPVNTVNDNTNEGGIYDPNTTTVDINQTKLSDGEDYDGILANGAETPSGWVYLGTYTNVDRVVVAADVSAVEYVCADAVMLCRTTDHPKATSTTRIYKVGYTINETQVYYDSDFEGAFSVVDMEDSILLDAYNDKTSPAIVDDNITDLDVMV